MSEKTESELTERQKKAKRDGIKLFNSIEWEKPHPQLSYSRKVISDLVEAFERYGGGASMMHPRLTRAITAARKYLSENNKG